MHLQFYQNCLRNTNYFFTTYKKTNRYGSNIINCSANYLGLLEVKVFSDGAEESTEALQALAIMVFKQLDHAIVHDRFCQHLELEQLADEFDISSGASAGFILCFLKFLL